MTIRTGRRVYPSARAINPQELKEFRIASGLNQEEFAEKADLLVGTISKAERGLPILKSYAEAIAQALEREVDSLFTSAVRTIAEKSSLSETVAPRGQSEPQGNATSSPAERMSLITAEASVEHALLHYPYDGRVGAIQLYGAADQRLAPEEIVVHYDHISYVVPPDLSKAGEERIKELEEANRDNVDFFDGPCVRLFRWTASPPPQGPGAALERDFLHLYLRPVGWYDMERTNGVLRRELQEGRSIQYEDWVGLSRIASHFDVSQSKLTNMFGNAITILTTDGKVGFQDRGMCHSVGGGQLSSAVAENVNRYFDETDSSDPSRLVNPVSYEMKLSDGPDNNYVPKYGKPHPVATVRRGLNEETSWRMMDYVPANGIQCTGLCFGLDSLHPDALWIVLVKLSAYEFERECINHKGKDWQEGRIRFVPADFENADTQRVLSRKEWIAAGKASMVRAIELVTVVKQRKRETLTKIFDVLAT